MRKPPAFQFYVDNFIEGTIHFTPHEIGVYVRLLCYQWSNGKIPKDKSVLKRIAGGEVSKAVLTKFPRGKNRRLEAERQKQLIWREKCSKGGKNSAVSKASTTLEVPLKGEGAPKGNTPLSSLQSPSPVPQSTTKLPASVQNGVEKKNGFTPWMIELTERYHRCLATGWENDRQKWMTRIKRHTSRCERVIAEVENAAKEGRIKTTPARYAEQQWKEFA